MHAPHKTSHNLFIVSRHCSLYGWGWNCRLCKYIILHQIIISESAKVIYTKEIDNENEKGFYTVYKQIVNRLSDIVKEINPNYEYPHMLISSTIDGALHQRYFSQHFPSLIDNSKSKDCVSSFYTDLVFNAVKWD